MLKSGINLRDTGENKQLQHFFVMNQLLINFFGTNYCRKLNSLGRFHRNRSKDYHTLVILGIYYL